MPSLVDIEKARELRRHMNGVERRLWSRLRGRGIEGVKFRRQAPMGIYLVDFVAHSHRLVVEIDGPWHDPDYDRQRDAWLDSVGYRVIRVMSEDVDEDLDWVVELIWTEVTRPGSVVPVSAVSAPVRPPPARLRRATSPWDGGGG